MHRRTFLCVAGMASAAGSGAIDSSLAQTREAKIPSVKENAAFVHPGIMQTRAQLDAMKRMIIKGQEPVSTAWKRWMSLQTSALDFAPKPAAHVLRSAGGHDRSGADEFSSSGQAAHSHALQWYIGGNEKHAEKAIEILDAWAQALWDFSGNDAKLLAAWTGAYFCEAAEILRATYPGWNQEARLRFRRMLTSVLVPLLSPFFPEANGNWDGAIMFTLMAIAIYLDDRSLFNRAVSHYQYGYTNSGILKYVWASGQCEESCRDQGHVQLGLGYFSYAALVAWNQGVDLFRVGDNRLALGYEYTSQYMLGHEIPYFGVISPRQRGIFSDFYEAAYQHYQFDKRIDMPYTAQAAAKARNDDKAISAVWLFRGGTKAHPSTQAPSASQIAADAGAHDQSPEVDSSWQHVKPEQSLQAVIDALEGGGKIVLSPGIYELSAPLRLRSNLTLVGHGRETVLHLAPTAGEYAIVDGSSRLQNLTLRNLLIEGSVSTDWPDDPNQPRRERSTQTATPRGGISLSGNADEYLHQVRLDRITVRNCVSNGITISGAMDLEITHCDIADCGGNNAPGHGLMHNLLLNHVADCKIDNCRLVSSLGGCGISVQSSSRIAISNCELSRNWAFGAQFLDCKDVQLQASLLEANNAGAWRSMADGSEAAISTARLSLCLNGSDDPSIA